MAEKGIPCGGVYGVVIIPSTGMDLDMIGREERRKRSVSIPGSGELNRTIPSLFFIIRSLRFDVLVSSSY